MRANRLVGSVLVCGGLAVALLLGACGEAPGPNTDEAVNAINLETGAKRDFTSEKAVPAGWSICPQRDCSIILPKIPCPWLGAGPCLLNPTCNLKLRCEFDIELPIQPLPVGFPGAGAEEDPDDLLSSVDDEDLGIPAACELACLPKQKLTCEQLRDPRTCETRADCSWDTICADPQRCNGDEKCLTDYQGCFEVCRPAGPVACESLDKATCSRRDDCQWTPGLCPRMCADPDCNGPVACEPFCQPKQDPPPPPPPPPVECKRTGCSGQICAAEDVHSTCEWRDEYACYKMATCEAQANGNCGWTPNPEFDVCMKDATRPDGCELEYVLQCKDGFIDGCISGETRVHECVAVKPRPKACVPTGCSGQICAAEPIITTCEWRPEYACYKLATCEAQASGSCGWTPNPEFDVCMGSGKSPL